MKKQAGRKPTGKGRVRQGESAGRTRSERAPRRNDSDKSTPYSRSSESRITRGDNNAPRRERSSDEPGSERGGERSGRKPYHREESASGERKSFGAGRSSGRNNSDRPANSRYTGGSGSRDARTDSRGFDEYDSFGKAPGEEQRPQRPYRGSSDRSNTSGEKRRESHRREDSSYTRSRYTGDRTEKPERRSDADRSERTARGTGSRSRYDNDRPARKTYNTEGFNEQRKPRSIDDDREKSTERSFDKPAGRREYSAERPAKDSYSRNRYGDEKKGSYRKDDSKPMRRSSAKEKKSSGERSRNDDDGLIRLNRYISMAGICSRREADEMIRAGVVSVNGKVVTELGLRVSLDDDIRYNGERIRNEKSVYVLLNKPKDYITTMEDPEARKTVMELVANACKERIYPVGRLDRNTTGLLLFTNDGDLAKILTHPSSRVRKVYQAELDKSFKVSDMRKLVEGVQLDDGVQIAVDDIAYDGDGSDKKKVGLEIHSGQNRVVRRMFESLGYEVRKLDRVSFAGLTKKDLPRGRWRFLSDMEVGMLKMNHGAKNLK